MKIAFIGGRDLDSLGGIESYMKNLTQELVKKGYQPIVYCESDHNEIKEKDGIKIILMKGFKSNLICKPWVGLKATIRTILKEKDVSIIHYNAWPPSMWSWIARLAGKKTLLQGHGFEWRHSKYTSWQQKILKLMERITAWTNTNIILVSDEQKNYFKHHYHKKAYTIPTAVNLPSEKDSVNSDISKRFNIICNKYFLFLGRLSKEKNVDYLIKAFKSIDNYQLVIAGTNVIEPEFVEYLKKIDETNNNIIFTGAVYNADKDWLLKNAYCFCLPSTTEGMSIALLEAMSYHLPIIASNITPNKEILKENCIYIKPERINDLVDAFHYAIENKKILDTFVQKNYQLVKENYTWEKVTNKYVNYLKSLDR